MSAGSSWSDGTSLYSSVVRTITVAIRNQVWRDGSGLMFVWSISVIVGTSWAASDIKSPTYKDRK